MTRIFESSHDVATLGPLTAAGNPRRKLASLADLVRHMICCEGLPDLPLRAAAAKVLDTLAAADPQPDLYLTDPAYFACPITPETVLRAGRAERAACTIAKYKDKGRWSATSWGENQSQYQHKKVSKRPAIAERRGVPGLLDELREAWCSSAKSVADLDKVEHARVAMLYDAAAALFGLVEASPAEQSTQTALSPAIIGAAAAAAAAAAGHGQVAPLLKLPAIGDGPGCSQLYAEWAALGGESAGAGKTLATRLSCSPRTIQLRIKPHRDASEPQTKAVRASKRPKPKGVSAGSGLPYVWSVSTPASKR